MFCRWGFPRCQPSLRPIQLAAASGPHPNRLMCTIYAYRDLYHASQSKYDIKFFKRFIENYALLPVTRKWGMTDISTDIFLSQYENRLICKIYSFVWYENSANDKKWLCFLKKMHSSVNIFPCRQTNASMNSYQANKCNFEKRCLNT